MTPLSFKNARPFLAAALLPVFAAGCAHLPDWMPGSSAEKSEVQTEEPEIEASKPLPADASFALSVANEMGLPLMDAAEADARIALSEDPAVWFEAPVEPEPIVSFGSWGTLGIEKEAGSMSAPVPAAQGRFFAFAHRSRKPMMAMPPTMRTIIR